jgi:hypothetical protein
MLTSQHGGLGSIPSDLIRLTVDKAAMEQNFYEFFHFSPANHHSTTAP